MDYRTLQKRMEGVAVVHITPFAADGSIDFEGLRRNVRFLVENGIEIVVTNGNTAEFYSLTLEESRAALEAVVGEVGEKALVVAGIGYDAQTAAEMARHAERTGAHAVMVHNPVHPYMTAPGLKAYFDRIADAVGIGVIPYVRSPQIDIDVLAHVARKPNVVACKYAVNDLQLFGEVVAALPAEETGMAWLCGTAEAWAPFFYAIGARGFTSGLANLLPHMALEMLRALQRGDMRRAMELWHQIRPFEALRSRKNSGLNVSVVKAAMAMLGLPAGGVRPPIAPLSASEDEELRRLLVSWGVLKAA